MSVNKEEKERRSSDLLQKICVGERGHVRSFCLFIVREDSTMGSMLMRYGCILMSVLTSSILGKIRLQS